MKLNVIKFICLIQLWALVSSGMLSAQTVITIGTGTSTSENYPFNGYYDYSWSNVIYKASDIGTDGLITKVAFYVNNTRSSNYVMNSQKIYVRHTTSTAYTTSTYPGTTGFTLVFDGTITYNANTTGWKDITLTTPFVYNGSNNLEFLFENRDGSYNVTGFPYFRVTTGLTDYRTRRDYSDYSFPSSCSSCNKLTVIPNIQLTIQPCGVTLGTVTALPTTILPGETSTLTITGQDQNSTLRWQSSIDNNTFTNISGATSTSYTTAALYENKYYRVEQSYNGCVKYTTSAQVTVDVSSLTTSTVGTGTSTTEKYPFNGYYDYSWSNIIYKASEINSSGQLARVSFYVDNSPVNFVMTNQKIYVRHTTANGYSNTSYPGTTGYTLVFDGSITYNGSGWKEIVLSTPFNYNGIDNLEFLFENRDGSYGTDYPIFRGQSGMAESRVKRDYKDASFPTTCNLCGSYNNIINIKMKFLPCNYNAGSIVATNSPVFPGNTATLIISGQDPAATIQWQSSSDNINFTTVAGATNTQYVSPALTNTSYYRVLLSKNGCSKFTASTSVTINASSLTTSTIGTGTAITEKYPFDGYYNNSWSNAIYKASEINASGKLARISFYVDNSPSNCVMNNQKIYVQHTTATGYTQGGYTGTSASDFSLVYDGSITYNGSGWKEIVLNNLFDYNGTDNLEFLFENRDGSFTTDYPMFRMQTGMAENRTKRDYDDASFPITCVHCDKVNNLVNIKMQFLPNQTAGYFRSTQSGDWNQPNTWQYSADNITWEAANTAPDFHANTITIQSAHTVTITASITIDQTAVNGTLVYGDNSGSTITINNGTGTDLTINGTFQDLGANPISWAASSSWLIGNSGTLLRTRSTSSDNWRDQYQNGISTIPATANWIIRKTGTDNPTLTSTGGMAYPNLTIENNTSTTWVTSSTSGFTGSTATPIIKGNFDIGGNGTGTVSFLNDNAATAAILVNGNLNIKAGSILRSYGTGFEVQGNLTVNGSIDYGTGNAKFVFSGNNNQNISGTGTIAFKNVQLNKASTSATVTLQNPATVNGEFTFTNGYLIANPTNILTFENGASASAASNNSFVEGIANKIGNSAFVFPIGKNGNYQPISISAPSNSAATYSAEYFHSDPALGTAKDSTIDSVNTCEYWVLNNVGTAYPVRVTLGWNNQSCAIASGTGNMRLTEWNGTKWIDLGNIATPVANVTSANAIISFGTFTLAQKRCYDMPILIVVANPNSILSGQTSILTASGGGNYLWSTGEATSSITVSPSATTFYSITVTNSNGCKASTSTGVTVSYPSPDNTVSGINFCGATKEYLKGMNNSRTTVRAAGTIAANSMYQYVPQTAWTGSIQTCGSFNVYYQDDIIATPAGFDETTGGLGAQRKATLCAVLTYVSNVWEFHGATIDLFVNQSFSSIHPFTLPFGTLASAGPEYPAGYSGTSGIYEGYAFNHITTGNDPDNSNYDMNLTVNFDQYYGNGNFHPINYFNDYQSHPAGECSFDLYSILLHEITHGMGFISFISEDPTNHNAVAPNNSFSKFDQDFLYYGDILTGPLTKLVDATPSINSTINNNPDPLRSNKIWLYGSYAPDQLNQPVYSGTANTFYPPNPGSFLSHLNFSNWSFPGMSQYSPGYQPRYLMGPSIYQNELKTEWTLPEMRILNALGYEFNSSFAGATSLNGSDLNSSLLNNTPPNRSNPATLVTDLNGNINFPEVPIFDFQNFSNANIPSQSPVSQLTIDIASLPDINDNDADQISIMPGSLFGIRGVSSGGNNHNCLQDIIGAGGKITGVTYTPVPGYRGIAQFGFYLWDGHEKGAFKTISIDVQNTWTPPVGTELAVNGSFEDGTEVRQYPNNLNLPYSTLLPNEEGTYFQGDHFSGGHPYPIETNRYVPTGGGQIIMDSYFRCGANVGTAVFPPFGSETNASNPTAGAGYFNPLPNNTIPNNERYAQLLSGGSNNTQYYINLSDNLHQNQFYRIEFDVAFSNGNTGFTPASVGDNFNFEIQAISNPIPSPWLASVFQTVNAPGTVANVNASQYDMLWQHVVADFQYCPADLSNTIAIHSSENRVQIDNFSIKEMINPPNAFSSVSASAMPLAGICAGSVVTLLATPDYPSCAITYIWQPGNITGQSITVSPATTTTYTVTADDGFVSSNSVITVSVTSPQVAETFSYSGSPYCQTAGTVSPTLNGAGVVGTFSASPPVGIVFVSNATGEIDLAASTPGTYTITNTVAASGACPAVTATSTITITAPPVSNAGSDITICNGNGTVLNGTGLGTYLWTPTTNLSCSTCPNPTANPTVTTVYTLEVSNVCGTNTDNVTVEISNPIATITSSNNSNCIGDATASVTGGVGQYIYLWNDQNAQTTATASNLAAGTYFVTVTDAVGCSATGTVNVSGGITFDYPNGYPVPSAGDTWSSGLTITVNGIITVPAYAIFTINNGTIVEFAENSGIIVNSGAELVLDNLSVLKGLSACNNMWKGIDVKGNDGSIGAGTITIIRSTISDAHIAIDAEAGTPGPQNTSYSGIIKASAGTFLNNRTGIKMNALTLFHSGGLSNSFIQGCNFTCNAALLDVAAYSGEGTENFIQLNNVRNGLLIANNYFNGNAAFTVANRGTGIATSLGGFTANTNHFDNLNYGIIQTQGEMVRSMIINDNTFTGIPFGILSQNGVLDEFTNNKFSSIPNGQSIGTHTYGMYLLSSGGFNIQGNTFTGDGVASTNWASQASHGIVFNFTGANGGTCFDNGFSLTDFAVHTQFDNPNLKIRCNRFSDDGTTHTPHYRSAWWSESGTLRPQGLASSNTNEDDAAGNLWQESSATLTDQDIYTNIAFDYYANQRDVSGDYLTQPLYHSSAWTGLHVNTLQATSSACSNPLLGMTTYDGGYNQQRSLISDSIAFVMADQQLAINGLLRQYIQNNDSTGIVQLLRSSSSSESKKLLAEYYLSVNDYTQSRATLADVITATSAESSYQDSTISYMNNIENINFCQYINVMLDLYEANKTISQLDASQIIDLEDVANAHVKISVKVETILETILNQQYTHPILKSYMDRGLTKFSSPANNNIVSIYPNPNSGFMTLEYHIDQANKPAFVLYDILGNEVLKMSLSAESNKIQISADKLKAGVYYYRVISNNKIISTDKVVIIK